MKPRPRVAAGIRVFLMGFFWGDRCQLGQGLFNLESILASGVAWHVLMKRVVSEGATLLPHASPYARSEIPMVHVWWSLQRWQR